MNHWQLIVGVDCVMNGSLPNILQIGCKREEKQDRRENEFHRGKDTHVFGVLSRYHEAMFVNHSDWRASVLALRGHVHNYQLYKVCLWWLREDRLRRVPCKVTWSWGAHQAEKWFSLVHSVWNIFELTRKPRGRFVRVLVFGKDSDSARQHGLRQLALASVCVVPVAKK